MHRQVKIEKIDHFKTLVVIRIEDDENYQYAMSAMSDRQGLNNILQSIISNPQLIEYEIKRPHDIKIIHENSKWVLIATIEF
jgi:uncharacterized protein YbaA (DUF1428 family)